MGRKKRTEKSSKEKIIEAALRIFIKEGYEDTTVRMILEESGTVAGSFYHYFDSKEELFEAVMESFLIQHVSQIAEIARNNETTLRERIETILIITAKNALCYQKDLNGGRMHWTMEYSLHKKTMQAILPEFKYMLTEAILDHTIENPLNLDEETLAAVVLNGIEGILHIRPVELDKPEAIAEVKRQVMSYVDFILGMK